MIPNFERIKEISYALLEKGRSGRCHHIAFISRKSKILSIGINDYNKTHPKLKEFNYNPLSKIHAEMAACLKLGLIDCTGLTMFSLRVDMNDKTANAKPCLGCARLISSLSFKECYYTNDIGTFDKFKF